MTIDWWTLALQALNFLILVWVLQRLLYRPVKDIIAKRKALADAAFAEADKREAAAEDARKQYEDGKAALADERQALVKKLHEEAEAEKQAILKEAKAEADRMLVAAKAGVEKEREAAREGLRKEVAGFAVDIAAQLLAKADLDIPPSVFLDRLETHLRTLPDAERQALNTDLAEKGAELKVITAASLATADQQAWRSRLGVYVPEAAAVVFEVNPAILGGAELHAPHAVIRFTWADQLAKAGEALGRDDHA